MSQKKSNKFLRFSQMGIVMGVIIGGFAYLGLYLDGDTPDKKVWTVALTLFGVILAMAVMIRDIMRITNTDED